MLYFSMNFSEFFPDLKYNILPWKKAWEDFIFCGAYFGGKRRRRLCNFPPEFYVIFRNFFPM